MKRETPKRHRLQVISSPIPIAIRKTESHLEVGLELGLVGYTVAQLNFQ